MRKPKKLNKPKIREACYAEYVKCRHIRRHKDWIGIVHQIPWGMPEMADIQWIEAPLNSDGKMELLPAYPIRYPVKDLVFGA